MDIKSDNAHYIVGIGASAGGLEAYNNFFDNAPENSRLSYILVQHLSPDYKSLLVDLLSRHTHMKIFEAENEMEIRPNCIYVIPPGKNLTVGEDRLIIIEKDSSDKGPNTSIDTFFYSLADTYGDRAIAIVLSGTGTDGSRGIEAIKDAEGLVIVQDPQLAKFDGMPRSSIATGRADLILPTSKMHVEIINYINELPIVSLIENEIDQEVLNKVLNVLHKQTGCDFQQYKMPTILRRLTRRLAFLKISTVEDYLQYITENTQEGKIFCKDLLIGVTKFFRDKDAFDNLREKVLIPLIDSKHDFETIKIWISACSTGEEAYSIAILLHDLIRKRNRNIEVKIFATDLDASHIEKASKAEYPEFIDKEIPKEYLGRYFIKRDHSYTVIPEIRKQIVFAKHNLITDPPFIKNDLVSCRNMLIYVNTQLQKIILSKFSFGLNKNGYLFLGPSESIATNKDSFVELDRKWKLYSKADTEGKGTYPGRYEDRISFHANIKKNKSTQVRIPESISLGDAVNQTILEDFAIVGFYLDRNYIIQDTVGNYKKYLVFPEEGLKFNLLKMLPDTVSIPLNTAIIKAWKNNESVMLNNLHYELNGQFISLVISVRPDKETHGNTLVMFNSTPYMFDLPESNVQAEDGSNKELVNRLKRELKESKFNLQTAIEELETTNEELQSSNEELLSSNEELQSSNEELQSLNEELHTLNTEHQLRIQELIDLNDDLNNYFRCSDIGQVIVDKDLLIRKFNPAAAGLINIIENDITRSITHLTTNFKYDHFERDIKQVLVENRVLEKELNLDNGVTLLVRIYSYIRKNNVIDGALISFIDISGFKKLNSIINGVFDASKSSILALSASRNKAGEITDLFSITSNTIANDLFGRNLSEEHVSFSSVSNHLYELIYKDLVRVVETGKSFVTELGINDKWFDVSAVKMMDGLALTLNDISDRKTIEDQLRKSYGDLFAAKENLKMLNHNLERMVDARTRELATSEERFRLVSTVTNDVVVDWNFMNNSIWLSNNYERLFGYKKEDVESTRKFWLNKIHAEDRDRVNKAIHASINNSEPNWELEYRYQHADGSYKIINDRGYLMLDEHGTPYRMLSSMLDVTEIRQAESELKESEMRLSMALDAATTAAWSVDLNNEHFVYSHTLPEIFGRSAQDQFTVHDFVSQIHPEDMPVYEAARAGIEYKGLYEYEVRIMLPDNRIKWIKTIGKVHVDAKDKKRLVGILREVTKEKEASQLLEQMVVKRTAELRKKNDDLSQQNEFIETIFDASVNSIAVVNKDLIITSVNKACEDIFMIKRETAIGQKYTDVFNPSEAVFDYTNILSVFSGQSLHNSVLINRGSVTTYLDNYCIPLAYNNTVYGALIISHDITEINAANQKLSQINNQLRKSNSDLEQFAYIASHDLQEPLRKIRVFISLLNQKRAKDDVDSYLQKIAASAERMSSLIKNVLDFSRLSYDHDSMTEIDLNSTINYLLVDFELIIKEKEATINVGKLPHISGIPHQISQLFSNLLSNSLKFCVHKPLISIDAIQLTAKQVKTFEHLDATQKYICISVKDNGIGFEQKYADKVFGFFYRMAHTDITYKGNGIGLALCKKIVENHGGLITVQSEIDKGTLFKIILPVF